MKREAITIRVFRKANRTRRKIQDLTDVDVTLDETFARVSDIVDLEIEAGARAGLVAGRIAVERENARADVELDVSFPEGLARLQAEHVAIESQGLWDVTYGICDECDVFDHASIRAPRQDEYTHRQIGAKKERHVFAARSN